MNKWLKGSLVVVGAVLLTTLAINASDLVQGISGNLPGMVIESTGPCGENATLLQLGATTICMDLYEASPDSSCPAAVPGSEVDTTANLASPSCVPASEADVVPWRFVSLSQAQQLCARVGKRLPSNEEWYKAVVGSTDIESCAINTRGNTPEKTGSASCTTPAGIHDMIGNVWEWVDEQIVDGVYEGRGMPEDGYVQIVDSEGMVLETGDRPNAEYGNDYAWTSLEGVRGIIRGGFYGSGDDGGLFTINASVPLDFKATGVGFRCVKDV